MHFILFYFLLNNNKLYATHARLLSNMMCFLSKYHQHHHHHLLNGRCLMLSLEWCLFKFYYLLFFLTIWTGIECVLSLFLFLQLSAICFSLKLFLFHLRFSARKLWFMSEFISTTRIKYFVFRINWKWRQFHVLIFFMVPITQILNISWISGTTK